VEKVNVRRKKSDLEALDIPMLMKMAKNCASKRRFYATPSPPHVS
jgi:hypothetical protein